MSHNSNVTCEKDPARWVITCLQSANIANHQGCVSWVHGNLSKLRANEGACRTDVGCLCNAQATSGNFAIFETRCVSDGCINGAGTPAEVTSAYEAAVTAQSSICAPCKTFPNRSPCFFFSANPGRLCRISHPFAFNNWLTWELIADLQIPPQLRQSLKRLVHLVLFNGHPSIPLVSMSMYVIAFHVVLVELISQLHAVD